MHSGELKYHIVWCTKYRRDLIKDSIEYRLKELIQLKCKNKNFNLISIETMPDHIHVLVSVDSSTPVKYIANQLKGYTSNKLRKEFKILRTRVPTLWTRSYYAGTVGNTSEETVKRYIENQKNV